MLHPEWHETPFDLVSCSWPRPIAQTGDRWTSEPEWDAPPMPYLPPAYWRTVGRKPHDHPIYSIDWRDFFSPRPYGSGEMRGFHVVFRVRVTAGGKLLFWDDDGSIIRRDGRVIHEDRAAHGMVKHEIPVEKGDLLEIAQWQNNGDWQWGAFLQARDDIGPRARDV